MRGRDKDYMHSRNIFHRMREEGGERTNVTLLMQRTEEGRRGKERGIEKKEGSETEKWRGVNFCPRNEKVERKEVGGERRER